MGDRLGALPILHGQLVFPVRGFSLYLPATAVVPEASLWLLAPRLWQAERMGELILPENEVRWSSPLGQKDSEVPFLHWLPRFLHRIKLQLPKVVTNLVICP